MTIVLHDPANSTYYLIDQDRKTFSGWHNTIGMALTAMEPSDSADNSYYTMTIDEYNSRYPEFSASFLDQPEQPYEFW